MWRERALKVALVVVGLLFVAGIYPLVTSVRDGWQANKGGCCPMMLSLYVTLGIFLLLAARNPSANRSVIAFAAWANIAHAAVETACRGGCPRCGRRWLVTANCWNGEC